MPKRTARLYDAVGATVGKFLADEFGRKALVIVALADDEGSESSLEDALRTLKQNDVIAYVLEVSHEPRGDGDDCDIRHIFRETPRNRIARMAEETGGRVIRVAGFDRMRKAFAEIADELHQQYSLGYQPSNLKWDGAFRHLQIKAPSGMRVSARDGYYATRR
jgi:VWFA-related protein